LLPATRINVARYAGLTVDQVRRLLDEGPENVAFAVAANPTLPAAALPILTSFMASAADPSLRIGAAYSAAADAETRDRLITAVQAEAAAGNTEADIALNWTSFEPAWLRDQPLPVRMSYLDCPHAVFRRIVAGSSDLPDEAWRRLDDDPDVKVRRTAARRSGTPADVLERLARSRDVPDRKLLVAHPNFPRHRLHTFVDETDPVVRRLAEYDPDLPAEILRRLAADSHPSVRCGAAGHLRLTPALFDQLLADSDPYVVDHAGANPSLPEGHMRSILVDANL
jgi:hypothetical protein